jgi:mono/diheme cytochrome c family protein
MQMKKTGFIVVLVAGAGIMIAAQTKPVPKKNMDAGKKVYDTYCLVCHQQDGAGVPRLNPPLVKTTYVLGDKKRLINIILKGMNEEIEIDGNFYSNVMAAHDFLGDQEIADLLTYVRNSFGNKASMITPAEVKTERAKLTNKQ